jgi:hypothetical protein
MSLSNIKIEGTALIATPSVSCVCAFCGEISGDNSSIVFDFKQQKVLYLCSNNNCKKMNELNLHKPFLPPMPKTRTGI